MTRPAQELQVLSHSKTQTSHPGNPHLHVHAYSVVWESLPTPWTVACKDPLSMGFSRQEYWSGLPFPTLGDLPHSGIEPVSPALAGGLFITEPPGKPPWSPHHPSKVADTAARRNPNTCPPAPPPNVQSQSKTLLLVYLEWGLFLRFPRRYWKKTREEPPLPQRSKVTGRWQSTAVLGPGVTC